MRTTERQEAEAECAEKNAKWPSVGKREVGEKQGIGVRGRTGERMWASRKEGEYSKGRKGGREREGYIPQDESRRRRKRRRRQ